MKNKPNHIIKTQDIEIEFRDRKQDMGLPNQISDLVNTRLNEKIGNLFDELLPNGNLAIDELNIDLGELQGKNWENEFIEKALLKIKQAVVEQTPTYSVVSHSPASSGQGSTPDIPGDDSKTKNQGTDMADLAQVVTELNYFLNNGHFTWRFSSYTIAGFEEFFMEPAKGNVRQLQQQFHDVFVTLLQSQYALTRLTNQFSSGFLIFISEVLPFEAVADDLKKLRMNIPENIHIQLQLALALWYGFQKKIIVPQEGNRQRIEKNIRDAILRILEKSGVLVTPEVPIQKTIDALMHIDVLSPTCPEGKGEVSSPPLENLIEVKKKEAGGEHFISNAGLVLLHPYLSTFFKELEYIDEENEWINDATRNRAVLITQFLVDGEEKIEEHKLLLNKLLYGVPFEIPLENELLLTGKEKFLCAELLQAVIQNWAALKSTSIKGLQNSFLIREGQMTFDNETWALTVEQKGWDILLAQLPWGISIIKTPWMQYRMQVNWG